MAAPNIVNVSTITGVTTWKAGISTLPGTPSVVVSNAASSGKVIKINSSNRDILPLEKIFILPIYI